MLQLFRVPSLPLSYSLRNIAVSHSRRVLVPLKRDMVPSLNLWRNPENLPEFAIYQYIGSKVANYFETDYLFFVSILILILAFKSRILSRHMQNLDACR